MEVVIELVDQLLVILLGHAVQSTMASPMKRVFVIGLTGWC